MLARGGDAGGEFRAPDEEADPAAGTRGDEGQGRAPGAGADDGKALDAHRNRNPAGQGIVRFDGEDGDCPV